MIVSRANGCEYCVRHHAAALVTLGETAEVVDALARGDAPSSGSAWSEADAALAAWVRQAAVVPHAARAIDLEPLRTAGLDDAAILDAALVASYFCFVNRLVLLLGVELETGYERTCT